MTANDNVIGWQGSFRGIDPDGLRAVADVCSDRSVRCHDVVRRLSDDDHAAATLVAVRRHIGQTGASLHRWSRELRARADQIEALQRAALRIGSVLSGGGRQSSGAGTLGPRARLEGFWDVRRLAEYLAMLEPATRRAAIRRAGHDMRVRWVGAIAHRTVGRLPDEAAATLLDCVVDALDTESLMELVDDLVAAGHGPAVAGLVGPAASRMWDATAIDRLVAHLAARLRDQDRTASLMIGHLVRAASDPGRIVAAVYRVGARLGSALRESGRVAVPEATPGDAFEALVTALVRIEDPVLGADVVVDLMAETQRPEAVPWVSSLDAGVAALLQKNPEAVLAEMERRVDPDGSALVPWLTRQTAAESGPQRFGIVAAAVGGEPIDVVWLTADGGDSVFPNARLAGYVAGAMEASVRRRAAAARGEVDALAVFAAAVEVLVTAATRLVKLVEVIGPAGLDVGVASSSARADARIGAATEELLERLDERFEATGVAPTAQVLAALDVFDERRDEIVAANSS